MIVGAHISISKGIDKSIEYALNAGCECLQIFISNPRAWREPLISDETAHAFKLLYSKSTLKSLIVHMPYLANIASDDKVIFRKSIKFLKQNIDVARKINADYYVIHCGSSKSGSVEKALKRNADAINILLSNTKDIQILLENTAGQGSQTGFTFSQLKSIYEKIKNKKRFGFCMDTAHLYGAGYDLSSKNAIIKTLNEMKNFFNLNLIKIWHFNDTTVKLGSNIDRHTNIGKGNIGLKGFEILINLPIFDGTPAIIETPESPENKNHISDIKELNTLKKNNKKKY